MAAPETELYSAIETALKADSGVQATALGAAPRIFNRVPPKTPFPYVTLDVTNARAWDTTTDRGHEFDVELRVQGEYEGDKEGHAILYAFQVALRDWAPQALSSHRLVNLTLAFSDVRREEDGKRYFGLQRWRAVTEETS